MLSQMDRYTKFYLLCIIISEHDFISNFVVVVKYFVIFADIIFINLRLLNPPYVLSGESYHGPILIVLEYNILTYFLLSELQMLLHPKCLTMGHLHRHRFL